MTRTILTLAIMGALTVRAVAGLGLSMSAPQSVTRTGATVRAYVSTNSVTNAAAWFLWGTMDRGNTNALWQNTNSVGLVMTGTTYSVALSGLTSGTTYYATFYATNGATNAWAATTNFTTIAPPAPTSQAVHAYPDGGLMSPTNLHDIPAGGLVGTVPLGALSGITSNQLDVGTDAAYRSGISALTATSIAEAVVAPYTNHQDRADNPHSTTAGQVGAMTSAAVSNLTDSATNRLYAIEARTSYWETAWINSTQWVASVAYGITSGMTSQWDQAYIAGTNWLASVARNITAAKTNEWSLAYSWGNHASAGYLTPASTQTIAGASVSGTVGSATVASSASGIVGVVTGDIVTNRQHGVTLTDPVLTYTKAAGRQITWDDGSGSSQPVIDPVYCYLGHTNGSAGMIYQWTEGLFRDGTGISTGGVVGLVSVDHFNRILYGKWTQRTNENYTSGFDVEGPLNALGGGNILTNGSPLYCTPLQATNAAAAVMATGTVYNASNLGGIGADRYPTNLAAGVTDPWHAVSNVLSYTTSTVTLSRAMGEYVNLQLTNNCVLTFDDSYPTNGASIVALSLNPATFSTTFSSLVSTNTATNTIPGTAGLALQSNQWNQLIFFKSFGWTNWGVRQ